MTPDSLSYTATTEHSPLVTHSPQMTVLALLVLGLSAVGLSIGLVLQNNGLTVQTQQGPVAGTLITPTVRQFLGIPLASVVRWEPPQPPAVRNSTFQATQFGASCVQDIGGSHGEFLALIGLNQTVPESEQCLSLNIWTPTLERKQDTAVMIWIYGGGYAFGTSNTIVYEGQFLIDNNDDVLLVTINYRTNIFGFPGAPQLVNQSQSQNFGALDVDAAIQWVFDNIASFGGDPSRITIFGQSAGSALSAAFTFANPSDTRVKGVIQESGSLAGLPSDLTDFGAPFNPQAWNDVAKAVGCGTDANADQFNCMKAASTNAIKTAVMNGPNFVAIQDDITFFTDFDSRSAAGKFLKVPLLVGNNKNEGDIFVVAAEQLDLGFDIPGLTTLGSDAVTKIVFSCPAGTTASDHVKAGVPTFRYRYDAVFSDISSRSDLRAFHASELPIVFGTASLSPFGPPTTIENQFSTFVQSAWVAFARDPAQGLINLGWPRYNPNTNTLAVLGASSNQTGISFTSGESYDFGCGIDEALGTVAIDILDALGSIF